MTEVSVFLKNLKTCFESKDLDRENFSISAVQKACLISFFEARDTIVYGLNKGILFASYDDGVFPPTKRLRFSDEPKGRVINSKTSVNLDVSDANWNSVHKLFSESRKLGVTSVFAGSDPNSFARNIDKQSK